MIESKTVAVESVPTRTFSDFLDLTKPRIGAFVGLSAFFGALLAAGPGGSLARIAEAAVFVTLTAASASVLNQVLERDVDSRMLRTRNRPLPAGRVSMRDAILYGALLAVTGVGGLALRFNLLSALLALATLFAYTAIYTPMKRASTLNTVIGAVPGAAPPLLGYVAIAGSPGGWAVSLFAALFVWQFPHFMAIAWIHRGDYARAGLRMLPAMPGCERMAGRAALAYGLALLPVSLLPGVRGEAGIVYTLGALVLGLFYLAASGRFAWRPDERSARFLLLTSLVYLPLLYLLVLADPVIRVGILHG
ncbi:MAG: heme o synthase [Planctomycetota bacterium]